MKNHSKCNLFVASCFLLISLLSAPSFVRADETAHIADVVVSNSEKALLLYMRVVNPFTEEMEKGVENGIPVTFSFFIELYQLSKGMPDQKIISHQFEHTMNYDSLKQQYSVEKDEKKGRVLTFKSLAEAKRMMTDIHDLKLAELSLLKPGRQYLLKVKTKLEKKKLPLNFHYIIPFWQLWKFETDWYTMTFTYGTTGSATER